MAYSDFSLRKVKKTFGVREHRALLFEQITPIQMSAWLKETLDTSLYFALASSSEKARSEFIIVPLLLEVHKRNQRRFALYSGETFDVDQEQGLNGECDFLFSQGEMAHTIQAPVFTLVEAKKKDIGEGIGQCAAQMIGAQVFNQQEDNEIPEIFGCVTTGEDWQFLKLSDRILTIDTVRYYLDHIDKILGVLQRIIDCSL